MNVARLNYDVVIHK